MIDQHLSGTPVYRNKALLHTESPEVKAMTRDWFNNKHRKSYQGKASKTTLIYRQTTFSNLTYLELYTSLQAVLQIIFFSISTVLVKI